MCIYIRINMYTHRERDTYIYTHKYVSLHVFAHTDVHLSEHIYIHTHKNNRKVWCYAKAW